MIVSGSGLTALQALGIGDCDFVGLAGKRHFKRLVGFVSDTAFVNSRAAQQKIFSGAQRANFEFVVSSVNLGDR